MSLPKPEYAEGPRWNIFHADGCAQNSGETSSTMMTGKPELLSSRVP
jgi:hypothetical protein